MGFLRETSGSLIPTQSCQSLLAHSQDGLRSLASKCGSHGVSRSPLTAITELCQSEDQCCMARAQGPQQCQQRHDNQWNVSRENLLGFKTVLVLLSPACHFPAETKPSPPACGLFRGLGQGSSWECVHRVCSMCVAFSVCCQQQSFSRRMPIPLTFQLSASFSLRRLVYTLLVVEERMSAQNLAGTFH